MDNSYATFIDLAAQIAASQSEHVVSSSTFVHAWDVMSLSEEFSHVSGIVVHFDFSAKQAMASAAAWADTQQRRGQAGDVMLAVLIQADPVAVEALVDLGYDSENLTARLLSELNYSPGPMPELVSLPGAEAVASMPPQVRDAVRLKLTLIAAEASSGVPWERLWDECNKWAEEFGDDFKLDYISKGSLRRYLLKKSQEIVKGMEPDFVLWGDLRRSGIEDLEERSRDSPRPRDS